MSLVGKIYGLFQAKGSSRVPIKVKLADRLTVQGAWEKFDRRLSVVDLAQLGVDLDQRVIRLDLMREALAKDPDLRKRVQAVVRHDDLASPEHLAAIICNRLT